VPNTIEPATSGRAKCRGCGKPIAKGDLRLGERLANPFAEGEMTLWFHLQCAAYKRPAVLLEALAGAEVGERDRLARAAQGSLRHRRLPRIDGAERAPSGQAKCRSCRAPIARGAWRIRLVFYEEGRFNPGGSVHLECRAAYFESDDIADAVLHFSPELEAADRAELERSLRG
jgi:hypothetical protein